MKEAISKYTALEMRHVVGPRGRDLPRDAGTSAKHQDDGNSAVPCWLVMVAGGRAPGALERPAHGG